MGRKFAWPDDGKRHYYAPNPPVGDGFPDDGIPFGILAMLLPALGFLGA